MVYRLRAKADLKRPLRYSSDTDNQARLMTEPRFIGVGESHSTSPRSPTDSYQRLDLPSLPLSQLIASPLAFHHALLLPVYSTTPRLTFKSNALPQSLKSMPSLSTQHSLSRYSESMLSQPARYMPSKSAQRRPQLQNIQQSQKRTRKNRRVHEDSDNDTDDNMDNNTDEDTDDDTDDSEYTTSLRRPTIQSRKPAVESEPKVTSIFPSLRPAAFPTYSSTGLPTEDAPKDAHTLLVQGQQYARRLVEARILSNQKLIKTCQEVVDRLYACKQPMDKFTVRDTDQYKWYTQLKQLWTDDDSTSEVSYPNHIECYTTDNYIVGHI